MKSETTLATFPLSDASRSPYTTPYYLFLLSISLGFVVALLYIAEVYLPNAPAVSFQALYIIAFYRIVTTLLQPIMRVSKVSGDSMLPTIKNNDFILSESVSKYRKTQYKRGTIVCFLRKAPELPGRYRGVVKRIVGLPGEMISVKDGHFYIDDKLIDEPWNTKQKVQHEIIQHATLAKADKIGFALANFESLEVPPNHYFVVGDNRKMAAGSINRGSNIMSFIPAEHIYARVLFVFYM